jgi:hypothetical protein
MMDLVCGPYKDRAAVRATDQFIQRLVEDAQDLQENTASASNADDNQESIIRRLRKSV